MCALHLASPYKTAATGIGGSEGRAAGMPNKLARRHPGPARQHLICFAGAIREKTSLAGELRRASALVPSDKRFCLSRFAKDLRNFAPDRSVFAPYGKAARRASRALRRRIRATGRRHLRALRALFRITFV